MRFGVVCLEALLEATHHALLARCRSTSGLHGCLIVEGDVLRLAVVIDQMVRLSAVRRYRDFRCLNTRSFRGDRGLLPICAGTVVHVGDIGLPASTGHYRDYLAGESDALTGS